MAERIGTVRGRFAPTPSGLLHLGNAGTALLAWLQTRSLGGEMVLRMEDLDLPRCKPEWAGQAVKDMKWLGLDWDEGPDLGGRHAPYDQSKRGNLYRETLDRLWEKGMLYRCYCSRADILSLANAPHGLSSEGPAYPGTCRGLSETECAEREKTKAPSLRFAMPHRPVVFDDGIAGTMSFEAGAGGDFVVRRADGIVGYQLAVVVDDAEMGITDILRGWDLLDSTPRQILLGESLGLKQPRYAHAPLVLGPDGKRLAKRHGDIVIPVLRAAGVRPAAIVGLLAWLYGLIGKPEPVEPRELISVFNLSLIPRGTVTLPDHWQGIVGSI